MEHQEACRSRSQSLPWNRVTLEAISLSLQEKIVRMFSWAVWLITDQRPGILVPKDLALHTRSPAFVSTV